MRHSAILLAVFLAAGCSRPAEKAEDIRPVRVQRIVPGIPTQDTGYSGEVRARYETRLAFRVPGKITLRQVEVGQEVKRGQLLARLDPRDLQLSEAALKAQAVAAQAELDLASSDLKRYQELRAKNFISQAEMERRSNTFSTAKARYDQAAAQLAQSGNQSSYAALLADADGVVTALEAEAGQVVAAGQTVLRLARLEEKEVVISVPEQRVDELKRASQIEVRLWARPEKAYAAKLREIAPASDPVTRTYTVKISLPDPDRDMRLGMTASVDTRHRDAAPSIRIPLAALYERDRQPAVWVVDPDKLVVSLVEVKTGPLSGNDIVVDSGLVPGALVVTAGVHLLRGGQKVRLAEAVK